MKNCGPPSPPPRAAIVTAQINEQNRRNITAQLDVTVNRERYQGLEAALAAAGETLSRQVTRAAETRQRHRCQAARRDRR